MLWKQAKGVWVSAELNEALTAHGYKLLDDAWTESGRRTYVHDDDADRQFLMTLLGDLRTAGWVRDDGTPRSLHNVRTKELIELEPAGSEATGHFLHHMRCAK